MCKNCIYANEYGDCTSTGSECIQEEARREERDLQEGYWLLEEAAARENEPDWFSAEND